MSGVNMFSVLKSSTVTVELIPVHHSSEKRNLTSESGEPGATPSDAVISECKLLYECMKLPVYFSLSEWILLE